MVAKHGAAKRESDGTRDRERGTSALRSGARGVAFGRERGEAPVRLYPAIAMAGRAGVDR